jgi:hypothetical protein
MTSTKHYAVKINKAWQQSIDSIFECGDLLIDAKAKLAHGEFQKMIEHSLPFKSRTAQMLMAIAADKRLRNPKHASLLPSSWYTLYRLTPLSDEDFAAMIDDGTIHPEMQRSDIPVRVESTTVEAPEPRLVSVRYVDAPAHAETRVVPHYVEPPPRLTDMSGKVANEEAEQFVEMLEVQAELADRLIPKLDHEQQTRVRHAIATIAAVGSKVWVDH